MIKSKQKYSLRELATDLGLTRHFTEKYIEFLGIKGEKGLTVKGCEILFYSYDDFLAIKNELEKDEEEIEQLYSPKDISDMTGLTRPYICSIARVLGIKPIEKTRLSFRKVYYSEDQVKKIIDYINTKGIKKETSAEEEQNPLVTDKRFYNLSYFPDMIPECLKNLED